jgi:error-prone DNA polymerase
MGFRNIQGIRKIDVDHLVAQRKKGGFLSVSNFLARTHFSRDGIETLAMSDVFACFGQDQRHSFWKSIELRSFFERHESQQLSLFENGGAQAGEAPPVFQPMSLYEGILEDYRGLGYSLRGNAMKGIRSENPTLPKTSSLLIKTLPHGRAVTYAGVVLVLQRPPTANGVAFMTLEDEEGSVDLVFFKKIYERYQQLIRNSRFLIVKGKVERRGRSMSILVGYVTTFDAKLDEPSQLVIQPGKHPRSLGSFIN